MLARAISGCTTRPPSTATQALCTRILPLALSTDTSATPAPNEPERSLIDTPSARPCGRGAFQSDICATFSSTARARGVAAMRSRRKAIGSMLASTAIWSTNDSIANRLKTCPTARQCFKRTPCDVPRASMNWLGTW